MASSICSLLVLPSRLGGGSQHGVGGPRAVGVGVCTSLCSRSLPKQCQGELLWPPALPGCREELALPHREQEERAVEGGGPADWGWGQLYGLMCSVLISSLWFRKFRC